MGASTPPPGGFLRISVIALATLVFFTLILLQGPTSATATAHKQIDSDLIFEALGESKTNHERIRRRDTISKTVDSNLKNSESSQDDHWVSRVKRGLWDWFGTTTAAPDTPDDYDDNDDADRGQTTSQKHIEEYDEENTIDDNDEDDDEQYQPLAFDDKNHTNSREDSSNIPYNSGTSDNNDDEDIFNGGDVSSGASGDNGDIHHHVPDNYGGHPAYFRMRLTIMEPFNEEFNDKQSMRYKRFAEEIQDNIDDFFSRKFNLQPSSLQPRVVNIQKREADSFTSTVILDVTSPQNLDRKELESKIFEQIEHYHAIGALKVSKDGFYFRDFEAKCTENEIPCRSGECVLARGRCDGVFDCPDRSDEDGCNDLSIVEPEENRPTHESTSTESSTSNHHINPIQPPTTATSLHNATAPTHPPTTRCRADDVVRCTDDDTIFICSDQECDGHADCPTGTDEKNCPNACAEGELACDVSRCIPQTSRCDGISDCDDETDEEDCPPKSCRQDEFSCNDRRCIPLHLRCDGRPDCRLGDDEHDCPTKTKICERGDFHCGDGTCVYKDKRCDGINDCQDQSDEKFCPCKTNQFTCKNEHCIDIKLKCDGRVNCNDGSDEHGCPSNTTESGKCQSYEWKCRDGTCIDQIKRCNYRSDCPDNSDEINCCKNDEYRCNNGTCLTADKRCNGIQDCSFGEDEDCGKSCRQNQFHCISGECVDINYKCDGRPHCKDGSDEKKCMACQRRAFGCRSEKKCIIKKLQCNGVIDCLDKSDEYYCPKSNEGPDAFIDDPSNNCPDTDFQCAAGYCIMGYKRCNGIKDCPSGNDEDNCQSVSVPTCGPNQFECNDGHCVDLAYRCDTIPDCPDKSDEINCDPTGGGLECSPGQITCKDGSCVDGTVCDNIFDCKDGTDESDCGLCAPNQFKCQSGGCISEDLRCNSRSDCADGSDESDCVQHCPADQFRCGDGLCLDGRRRCDGYPDCKDHSDEANCAPQTCESDQFMCGAPHTNFTCIPESMKCDGYSDCPDGQDEEGCSTRCEEDEFDCGGLCIPSNRKCDGRSDCPDGADEFDCPSITQKPECNGFTCGNGQCIHTYEYCDGVSQCRDGSDESSCETCADPDWFQCQDGACVASNLRCDNFYDCRDFSDEQNCFIGCKHDEFQCSDGVCVPLYQRCDRRNDCSDGSDEYNCATEAPPVHPEPPYPPPGQHSCPRGQQPCRSGNQCYTHAQFCDGRADCNDLSDEDNCPLDVQSCTHGYFRCENGPCILDHLKCDGKIDCPLDSSDELDCVGHGHTYPGSSDGLNLKTYPNQQEIKESREVVFQCRDEGPIRAKVHWSRSNGLPLPYGSRDVNGRLEMPNIQLNHSGAYVCAALGYPASTPGAQVMVHLEVNKYVAPTPRPQQACGLYEATCSNGDCIAKHLVCDGNYDCSDGSDETRCNAHGCEPNEFRCANKRCVLKTWRCDTDNDCGDNSDEQNCATNPPGSPCEYSQFACRTNNQCIPRSFHCDGSNDCTDGTDEIGCAPVSIVRPPPPMMELEIGEIFEISCTTVGGPMPEVIWRLNWGHIPEKCKTTSVNGVGTLTCPDIQEADQGAYSCEGINIKGSKFATPDTILIVKPGFGVCPKGFFNEEARNPTDCISCFCFGHTKECASADLFTYHLPAPFDSHNFLGVNVDPITGVIDIRNEPIYRGAEPKLTPVPGGNGVHASLPSPYAELTQANVVPYFSMPENYHGNKLKSYGGYIKYSLKYEGYGRPTTNAPDIILTGNGYSLMHIEQEHQVGRTENISVRFFVGEWVKRSETAPETLATREEIMMALASVENILIKLQYIDGHLDTTIANIEMDSAAIKNTGLGQATFVEECRCPVGYSGLSCETCASGYSRHRSGPWLGQCYKEPETCPSGYYGDPSRGIHCRECPCPLTNPSNQFARTCHMDSQDEVVCDCPPEYIGKRCDSCAAGYTGNPLLPGHYCAPISGCSADGSDGSSSSGACRCKANTYGPNCDVCTKNSFHLSATNQFGCISCFCMGVSQTCSSSDWYRDQVKSGFTTSKNEFKLVESNNKNTQIEDGIVLDQNTREIVYSNFRRPDVYYWSLPSRFLGDKITAYGGFLKYSLRYVPAPGGQSSKNNAPDVELISSNHITLTYFAKEQPYPNNLQEFTVPLLEQYWQRSDGINADREHLMMALADVKAILIKATYTTNTREAALKSVSLDIADKRNTGQERAFAVEQCQCPVGYNGLSCEDCAPGYSRTVDGLYLGICEKCQCNGHSNECDPESGECYNCRDATTGENCESCLPGYEGDPANRVSCQHVGGSSQTCVCDPNGSISNDCIGGVCQCKTNVEGNQCNRCRAGTFGLNASISQGCQTCFCSGIASECRESGMYIEQIPSQIFDHVNHGFTLTDQKQQIRIANNFELNVAKNEIGFGFKPSNTERLFWSLPSTFTGNQVKSYGGRLEYTQRYTERADASYNMDQDVIIIGNGITIYWSNPSDLRPNIANKVSVTLSPSTQWQRLDYRQGPRPASREDIITVLTNIEAILIRAQLSSDTASSFISDLTLDTAVDQYTGQPRATSVEVCVCPPGYAGTSCETCPVGSYRDIHESGKGPLGSCNKCPCNGNEVSCSSGVDNRVACNCLPGYTGRTCEYSAESPQPTVAPYPPYIPSKPTITVLIREPQLTIKQIGDSVTFNCTASSRVDPNRIHIQWTKEEGSLPEDRAIDDHRGILVITHLRVSDSGNYICEASDGVSIAEKRVNLAVGGNQASFTAPRTDIYPQGPIQVNEGEPIEISCRASGTPQPHLTWNRVNGEPLNERQTFRDGTFQIPSASVTDQGDYECTAINSNGYHTSRVTVYVNSVVPAAQTRPIITPSYISGSTGDPFTLLCEAGGAREITWSRENGPLPYNSREENGILIVQNARPEDSDVYVCTVVDYMGHGASESARVSIQNQETNSYPSVKIEPTNQKVSQGSNVEIHCEASGSPAPTIRWTKVGESLPANAQQSGPVLKLFNVQMADRGIYSCVASSHLGLAQASSIVDVERRESPVIQLHPGNSQTITEGGNALLQCRITAGIPNPSITWHRPNGEALSRNIEEMSNGVLRFNRISAHEAGEYICTAENEVGKTTAIGNIIVQTPPIITLDPARETLTVKPGEFVRLECNAVGSPSPSIQWSRYQVGQSALAGLYSSVPLMREQMHSAIYEITSVSQSDEGSYICMAKNNAGATEKRIMLIVDNRDNYPVRGDITGNRNRTRGEDPGTGGDNEINPHQPHQPYPSYPGGQYKDNEPRNPEGQTFYVPVGTRAELKCNIQNNKEPIVTNWVRKHNADLPQYSEIHNGTLVIKNAQALDAGEYHCLGISENSGAVVFTITTHLVVTPILIPRISLNPPRQVVRPGDNAHIECSATGEQPIAIFWNGLNRSLPNSVEVNNGHLQFHGIQLSDAGRYRCTATNLHGEAIAVAEVMVQEHEQPTIKALDKEQSATSGSTVILTCTVRAEGGRADVRWYRDQRQPLPRDSRAHGDQLQLVNIHINDAGKYFCEISMGNGEIANDFIDLHVAKLGSSSHCKLNEWKCNDNCCIPYYMKCNGIPDCPDGSDEVYCIRNRRGPPQSRPTVINSTPPTVIIQANTPSARVGDPVELQCRSSESGVITEWTKVAGRLADNIMISGGKLRINNVRPDNAGVYRCEARGYDGYYHKDYDLDVIDDIKKEIKVKSVPQGSSVQIECRTDLEEPVKFLWSKQKGLLPRSVDIHARTIEMHDVGSQDAGTYMCTATNPYKTIELPTIILVTGIVPYFSQAPSSFIGLPALPDSYIEFNLEVTFKPKNQDGLIIYNGNKKGAATSEFISLSLQNGIPEFRFNLGFNNTPTIITGNAPLAVDEWHTIKIMRKRKRGSMYVNGAGPFAKLSTAKLSTQTLMEPLYLGGVPNFEDVSLRTDVHRGFVGCISLLKIGHQYTDIMKEAHLKKGVTSCETCSNNPCGNQGMCQEALSKEGFMCICPMGFSGPTCEKLGADACTAYTCGIGRCVDTDDSYRCLCPLGKSGKNCERQIEVIEPAFSKDAYVAYPTPSQQRRIKLSMKIKPRDLSDGVLAYCAENEDGTGDFLSIAVKNGHVEFRFNVGNGPTTIASQKQLLPDRAVVITATRFLNEGKLIVNGDEPVTGRSSGNHRALNLHTLFYVGGVDAEKIKISDGVEVTEGFHGCISEVSVSSVNIDMITSIQDSANVQDCSSLDQNANEIGNDISEDEYLHENTRFDTRQTGCTSNPCRNDGKCYPLSPVDYKCNCVNGYSGTDCEIAPNQCDQLTPCVNGGTCNGNTTQYACDCRLGFTGINCETKAHIRNDAHFDGNGYLEFKKSLLNHDDDESDEIIALELSTNSSNGLVFWQGQLPHEDGFGSDYIALAIVNGYLEFSYDLGEGAAFIAMNRIQISDGQRHRVILKRRGQEGSMEVDNDFIEEGRSEGITNKMNTNGNIYLGGTPNTSMMTGGRFTNGFNGCIHGFELQDSRTLDLGSAVSGLNVKACYRSNDEENAIGMDDDDFEQAN